LLELIAAGLFAERLIPVDDEDGNAAVAAASPLASRKARRETGSDMKGPPRRIQAPLRHGI
jgi:hypothetical protein